MIRLNKSILFATAAFMSVSAAPGSFSTALGQQLALEEIVVTSRKREESLLDVPLSITALTSADLEIKGIRDFKDVIDFTPGFFFAEHSVGRGDRSNRLLVVRGMRINTENDHQQATTVFVDGAPMMGSVISGLEDAERIEIVRGPQSAYFGRSTFAGAVNFITKNPSDEFQGKITANYSRFGSSDIGVQVEGPIAENALYYRLSSSHIKKGGQYENATNSTTQLGERETFNVAGTLYATPSENFSAKLRVQYWKDDDGPGAAVGYGFGNGEEYFNCNPSGSTLPLMNGNNNYICGKAPFPTAAQIQGDFIVTDDISRLIANIPDAGRSIDAAFDPNFIDGFGLERKALQTSLIMDYDFNNGMSFQSISAYHSNEWLALDDLDRRATAALPGEFNDTALLNGRDLEDYSQEFRISSSGEDRLRWTLGGSYFKAEGTRTSGFKVLGSIRSFSFGNIFDIETVGIFGSGAYDITEQLTLNVEARYQWDDVLEARTTGADALSGTFKSFTPRVILDYKPTEDLTLYALFARGNRPGAFNPTLIGLPQSVLDQLEAAIGAGLSAGEEKLDNYEVGFKGSLWDGRAQFSSAAYYADWQQQTRGATNVTFPDGSVEFIAVTGTGGKVKLWGIEFEGIAAVTENLTVEGTFSINDSEFKASDCADCLFLLGTREIGDLGKRSSRNPRTQGSASLSYSDQLNDKFDWFTRADYIFTGNKWATDANLLRTGASSKVNLRAGIETDEMRLEVYGTNVFNDKTFLNYQVLFDFAYIGSGRRFITAGLPDKASYGIRASYNF